MKSLIAVGFGLLFLVVAVCLSVLGGGFPGPDDSPAQLARLDIHMKISGVFFCVGVFCLLGGMINAVIRLLLRKKGV